MKVWVELDYWHGGGSLAERLGFEEDYFSLEASTGREVFEQLRAMTPLAREAFELRFDRWGYLNFMWVVSVSKDDLNQRGIDSQETLNAPLQEGDCIRITSASGE